MGAYMIQEETLTGIADQVRRLAESNAHLTPDEMAATLEGIDAGSILPMAEEHLFGNMKDVTEHAITGISSLQSGTTSLCHVGWKFEVLSPFSVKGFRMMNSANSTVSSFEPKLYRLSDSALIASASVTCAKQATADVMLDNPVNLRVGETYAVVVLNDNFPWQYWNNVTVNSKMKVISGISAMESTNPTLENILSSTVDMLQGVIIPIMGKPREENLPAQYSILAATMNDIAVEAQRLSSAEDKISMDQIVAALQGTPVLPYPPMPMEIVLNCSYMMILKYSDEEESSIWAYGSKSRPYYSIRPEGDSLELPSGRHRAMLNTIANEWMPVTSTTNAAWCNLSANWSILWADFNLPNGSSSASTIYHAAGSMVPVL